MTPPPRPPADERALQQARATERKAVTDKDALIQVAQDNKARTEQLQAELAALDAPVQAAESSYNELMRAYDGYNDALQAAQTFAETCDTEESIQLAAELGAGHASYLGSFVSDEVCDAVLKALEECRKSIVSEWKVVMAKNIKDLRQEMAVEIEDIFDDNNPYSRGGLTAKVSGTSLNIRMRGNFEGRARHSQDQVDMWCERGEGLFTKITLKNSHGTFSCASPKRPADLIAEILAEANVASSWVVVGEQAIPTLPPPPPPVSDEIKQQRAALIAELGERGMTHSEFEGRALAIDEEKRGAESTRKRIQANDLARVSTWKSDEAKKAGKVQAAGGVLMGIGGVALLASVGAWQGGVSGANTIIPVGLGVGIPILSTGLLMLIGGGVRKGRIQSL